ncbi:TonB-dependent receptor [Parabacteroides sp. ZJ-118]|uniref:TonB-dependent receptor n=1 Tax=Parabacteroides sp. ZJ-118 TaxID=2709398 RepID=UPI0013EB18D0|nr:TonB-dependent receptor [Parabacteroides sp. ZJ-118]
MKTIYTVKALCVVALLGSAAAAGAQEDVTKEKNLNREMTLEREYDPSVQDASKVNTLPAVKEPEVRKIPIDYSDYAIAADPRKEIRLLPSGNRMTQMDYNRRRGYLNLGVGTYLNVNGDLGYHLLSTERDQLTIGYSHRSTNEKVKYIQLDDEKVKAKLNDNLGGIRFKHVFDKTVFRMGARYGYSAFNYYGLPVDATAGATSSDLLNRADRETNQVDQTIAANIGFESKEEAPFGYFLDLGYINFSHKYGLGKTADGPTEHTVDATFDLNAGFNGNMWMGLGGEVAYFNYQTYELESHAQVTLSPYYKVEGDRWNLKLGANVMLVTGDNSTFMASPDLAADLEVADKTSLYVNAGGKLYANSMYEIALVNRYVNPTQRIAPSRNWLDATLGIKSGAAPGFWFDVFAGYKITSSDVLFLPSGTFERDHFANFCEAMDDIDTKQLFVGATLKYSYQQWFDVSLRGVYHSWKANFGDTWTGGEANGELAHAWGKPEMEVTAGLTVRPVKEVSVSLDYYLATGRYTQLSGADEYKMNNINELNLTGSYTFNDTWGVYAKLNNILCRKYELYYGYPSQGFGAMVGVNINF